MVVKRAPQKESKTAEYLGGLMAPTKVPYLAAWMAAKMAPKKASKTVGYLAGWTVPTMVVYLGL